MSKPYPITYPSTSETDEQALQASPQATPQQELAGKHILLGLTGGVACYKSAELCRLLIKAGATVQVVMTEAACEFITPVTMQALSGRPVFISQWDTRPDNNMAHINLSREADAMVLAPCSADFIARLAQGRSDELLSLMCLARPTQRIPLLIAPAMNREMWLHPATARNMHQVTQDGATILGIGNGLQACGETGDGRMLEPAQILHDLIAQFTPKSLAGKRLLVTAGPTFEAIDPVRGITNRSSGKMGFAIAQAAQEAGAEVTLISGPVALPTPRNVARIDVQSAQQMLDAALLHADAADIFIATAAVADWRPANSAEHKIKKTEGQATPALHFIENPDILATIAKTPAASSGKLYCVGFAAESDNLIEYASAKRKRKGIPLLVGNIGPNTFGQDDNILTIFDEQGHQQLPKASKRVLAKQLLQEIALRLQPAH
ncbi:bifunctional phosphopantothenoylcysteine decarboxylase/phosphopantothenate--cysteine ligase CoaBC [Lampropedia aestuarii]|uniref:bifunctional phosphopantothenoylcysteine decarboxylase/phosphopantothenate--cysteine ligase CoaBC n=1 Tax=Lampropedia aestuarii TaxID=2562762 RepID=UPI00246954D3|nr:bifunctional phosphopantothenoylcysteine decarboxylase/phosphopantothenate--cysteine ligase CoaBC [Lampropedia aestuarii]MDH5859215.1 bifunctional phosphopantothenoylcysteine decarboxylase/phosphopantothenate--cysteine ligase CoaBC [Lampropedia aestuarii]